MMDAWTLVYDGECGFCRWCTALVLAADRHHRLRPCRLQDPRAEHLLAGVPREQWAASWHLVSPAGQVRSAGAAIPVLCGLLPGFGLLGRLCRAAPNVTQRIYAGVARNRHRIGPRIPRTWIGWATRVLDDRVRDS